MRLALKSDANANDMANISCNKKIYLPKPLEIHDYACPLDRYFAVMYFFYE